MHEIDQNPGCYATLAGMSPCSSRVSSGKCLHDIPIDFVRLLREKHYLPHIVVHVGAADLCGFKIDKLDTLDTCNAVPPEGYLEHTTI